VIYAVKGRPGGGKSYYAARKAIQELMLGKCVVSNVNLRPGWAEKAAQHAYFSRMRGKSVDEIASGLSLRYHQLDPDDTDALRELFRVRVAGERESRGVAILDEAHNWLNARKWNDGDRSDYVAWFTQHRKLGFDVYLLSQAIESIDAQIRRLIEYYVVLRNLKRWKVVGISPVPVNLFIAITIWDGGPGSEQMITRREVFPLTWQKDTYFTMGLSHGLAAEYYRADALWLPRRAPGAELAGCVAPHSELPGVLGERPYPVGGLDRVVLREEMTSVLIEESEGEGDSGDVE
jgi:hypothetical protein